ncbi:MAG: hypothetical protein ACOX5X_01350 [Acholeplasmataceae bacterium]|jgi:hypothetical protein
MAGGSFAYWLGNISAPNSLNSNMNTTSGTGATKNLSLTQSHWWPWMPTSEVLVPKGTIQYAHDQVNAREEMFDDYRVSVPTSNGVTTNLIMEVKTLSFVPIDPLNPHDYSAYHQYLHCKVQIGELGVATNPEPYYPELTTIFNGSNLGYATYPLVPGADELYVRFTCYIEGAPNFTDPIFYEAIQNSKFNIQVELRLEDPNVSSGAVWQQYNVSGTSVSYTYQKPLGLYSHSDQMKEYDSTAYYYDGDVITVSDPNSPYYGKIYLVTQDGYIDLSNPGSLTYVESTKEYRGFHSYSKYDLVLYGDKVYMWNSNTHHLPNTGSALPPGSTANWVETTYNADYWFRYYNYCIGDYAVSPQNNQVYVALKNFLIAPNSGYNVTSATGEWVSKPHFNNAPEYSSSTTYQPGQYIYVDKKNKRYYIALVEIPAGVTPTDDSTVWRRVILP